MSRTYDCRDSETREDGLRTAATVIGRGGLVVMPTDTLYGLAADAFNPAAVTSLLAAKGRDRSMPPPVLVGGIDVLAALTTDLPPDARRLAEAFWPGGLTLICWAQPSLAWDLGDTGGTVAIRVPDHPVALALLRSCGPMATSSANLSGEPPAATAAGAADQLGSTVEVYLEMGELTGGTPSTIVDATGAGLVVVRDGAISLQQLREIVPGVQGLEAAAGGEVAQDVGEPGSDVATEPTAPDSAAPDSAAPDSAAPDSAAPDSAAPAPTAPQPTAPQPTPIPDKVNSAPAADTDPADDSPFYDARAAFAARQRRDAPETPPLS